MEVKGEQGGAESSPQQAEEQKDALVTPSFVSIEVEKPELGIHHQEESSIQSGVEDREAKLNCGGDSRTQGEQGRQGGGVGRRGRCEWSFHQGADKTNCPSSQRNSRTFSSRLERFT